MGGTLDREFGQFLIFERNFSGTIAHELTHVAVALNPLILDNWIIATNNTILEKPTFWVGGGYNSSFYFGQIDEKKQTREELLCMVNASLLYSRFLNIVTLVKDLFE